ncbi:MAG: hypothetical protein ACT4N8_16115, partial [Sphingosinicella sp.]|uniref:hypothetical protein n=1 Tax=Sphingosinicella sp. TaxID=1917971 RepID=UPI00403812FB
MIARGFKPVAWVGAIGAAALSCYMLSLQVAAERADLAGLERRIVATQQDIRTLQTELGTRGRMQQLEQWNAEVLALSAPVAGQFVPDHVSLARFDTRPQPLDQADVRLASAEVPPAPQVVAATIRQASLQQPAQATPPLAPARPPVLRARLTNVPAAVPSPSRDQVLASNRTARPNPAQARQREPVRTAAATPASAPPRARPARAAPPRNAPAARATALLDADTLRERRSEARAERRGG